MMFRSPLHHSQTSLLAAVRRFAAPIVAIAVLLIAGRIASAQITTDQLIGDSVSDATTKYSDVDEAIKRFNNRDVLGARQFLEAASRKNNSSAAGRFDIGEDVFLVRKRGRWPGVAREDRDG